MKFRFYILLSILLTAFAFSATAQDKKLKKADEIFESGEYWRAIQEYNAVLKKIDNRKQRTTIYFKIGECYYLIGEYKKARSNFRRSAKVDDYEQISTIRLAEIEIQVGNFEKAGE